MPKPKPKPKPKPSSPVVKTQAELVRILGVSKSTVNEWTKRGLPKFPCTIADVWRWRFEQRESSDPLLVGPESPALERYRAARAELSEIEVQKARGQLMDINVLDESLLLPMSCLLRDLGMRFQEFPGWGREATDMLDDTIQSLARHIEGYYEARQRQTGAAPLASATEYGPIARRPLHVAGHAPKIRSEHDAADIDEPVGCRR